MDASKIFNALRAFTPSRFVFLDHGSGEIQYNNIIHPAPYNYIKGKPTDPVGHAKINTALYGVKKPFFILVVEDEFTGPANPTKGFCVSDSTRHGKRITRAPDVLVHYKRVVDDFPGAGPIGRAHAYLRAILHEIGHAFGIKDGEHDLCTCPLKACHSSLLHTPCLCVMATIEEGDKLPLFFSDTTWRDILEFAPRVDPGSGVDIIPHIQAHRRQIRKLR